MLISVERRRDVSKVQHLATFLTVYPPPPSTSVGTPKLFTNFTHSLKPNKDREKVVSRKMSLLLCEMDSFLADLGPD